MKKLLALSLIGSTFYILPSKSEVTVSSGTKIYYSDTVPITNFSDSSGIGLSNGYTFTSDYQCFSNVTANSLNGGIITNQACLNKTIKPGSTSVIEIAPEIDNANIEIGSGSNPTTISQQGISVEGGNLLKKQSDGSVQIGRDEEALLWNSDGLISKDPSGNEEINISSEGLKVGGNSLITKKSNGEIHIGKIL